MTLCSVLLCYLYHIYSYNQATKVGMQSFLYVFAIMNPHSLLNMLLSKQIDLLGVFDGFYIMITGCLLLIVTMPMVRTLINVFN